MKRPLALLLFCLLLVGCARSETPAAPEETAAATAAPLPSAPAHPHEPLRVYFDGLLTDRGYVRDGVAYLAPETLCRYYGLESETVLDAEAFTLTLPGLTVEGRREQPWFTAEGRYLYAPEGWIEADGRLYLPADAVERLFGLSIALTDARADVGGTGYALLQGGEDYYTRTTQADDLFWLTHIIYSEAQHESLAGKIGVGNVVLNRVKDDRFPATVTAVVLDREHTIQFTPVGTGEVAAEPDEPSRIAAYLCLEGYSTAGGSLYFVNPDRGDDSWFRSELTEVCRIGNHVFYQ